MYYNVRAVIDTKLVKTCFKKCLVGLHEAKGDPLEKEKNQIQMTAHCCLERICLVDGLEKETGNFYHHVSCGKLPRWKWTVCFFNEGEKD